MYFPRCYCAPNITESTTTAATTTLAAGMTTTTLGPTVIDGFTYANATEEACTDVLGGLWECYNVYVPDVFLMSVILFFVTFGVAIFLVNFRNWPCFPTFVSTVLLLLVASSPNPLVGTVFFRSAQFTIFFVTVSPCLCGQTYLPFFVCEVLLMLVVLPPLLCVMFCLYGQSYLQPLCVKPCLCGLSYLPTSFVKSCLCGQSYLPTFV